MRLDRKAGVPMAFVEQVQSDLRCFSQYTGLMSFEDGRRDKTNRDMTTRIVRTQRRWDVWCELDRDF